MPISWTISRAERRVTVRAEGEIILADIEGYFDALLVNGAMPYAKFIDARGATPRMNDDDMMALGARVSAYALTDPRGPIAVVVDNEEAEIFVRRFFNLGGASRPGAVFWSMDEARRWLAAQPIPSQAS